MTLVLDPVAVLYAQLKRVDQFIDTAAREKAAASFRLTKLNDRRRQIVANIAAHQHDRGDAA